MAEMISRNAKSIQALMQSQQADFEFFFSKKGNLYFACGNIERGYCSKAVTDLYRENPDFPASAVKYAECSLDGGQTWVPCLMVVGNSRVAVKKFSF